MFSQLTVAVMQIIQKVLTRSLQNSSSYAFRSFRLPWAIIRNFSSCFNKKHNSSQFSS